MSTWKSLFRRERGELDVEGDKVALCFESRYHEDYVAFRIL